MKLKHRLIRRTLLAAAAVFSLMTLLVTQISFIRAVNAEVRHLGARLGDVAMGMEAVCCGYAVEGRSMEERELANIASQYGARIARTSDKNETTITRTGKVLTAACTLTFNGLSYEIALESSLEETFEQNSLLLWRCTLISAAGLVPFWAFMSGVAGGLLRPLQALYEVSGAWTAGNMDARAEVDGEDEIGTLGRRLNDMAAALEESIARRDRMISDLTHEMKTPLAAMMGHADLIRRKSAEAETLGHAHAIYKEASRLDALSRRMMQWILLKRDAVEIKCLHVEMLFEEVRAAFSARENPLEVETGDIRVNADRVLMETLLINLVENACHAEAKRIVLRAEVADGRAYISVEDDGCGMNQTALRRAEEPFYRVDPARSRAHGGAGLGLSLCRRIAQAHGTQLVIQSAVGRGTKVTIALEEADDEGEE